MFAAWASDPEVTYFLTWSPHTDIAESEAHIARCEEAWHVGTGYVHFLVERGTERLVGSIASRPGPHGVEFGYVLASGTWGQGLMVEVLDTLATWWLESGGAHRVWATCHVDNDRSVRVLEKAGFRYEGTLRRWLVQPALSPKPQDHRCYSRVRDN